MSKNLSETAFQKIFCDFCFAQIFAENKIQYLKIMQIGEYGLYNKSTHLLNYNGMHPTVYCVRAWTEYSVEI